MLGLPGFRAYCRFEILYGCARSQSGSTRGSAEGCTSFEGVRRGRLIHASNMRICLGVCYTSNEQKKITKEPEGEVLRIIQPSKSGLSIMDAA